MSGIGKKNKKGEYLIINYKFSEAEEVKVIIFDMKKFLDAKKNATALTNNIVEKESVNGVIEL